MYIYIYGEREREIYTSLSLSLSLCLYIYIHTHIHFGIKLTLVGGPKMHAAMPSAALLPQGYKTLTAVAVSNASSQGRRQHGQRQT